MRRIRRLLIDDDKPAPPRREAATPPASRAAAASPVLADGRPVIPIGLIRDFTFDHEGLSPVTWGPTGRQVIMPVIERPRFDAYNDSDLISLRQSQIIGMAVDSVFHAHFYSTRRAILEFEHRLHLADYPLFGLVSLRPGELAGWGTY